MKQILLITFIVSAFLWAVFTYPKRHVEQVCDHPDYRICQALSID